MKRGTTLAIITLFGAAQSCGREPLQPDSGVVTGGAARAKGIAGSYELRFLDTGLQPVTTLVAGPSGGELILGAHVESASGAPATGGSVTFEYCSLKGGPPNDIDRPDEAPREACRTGSGSWTRLLSLPVDGQGNAFMNFGLVMIPRTVGFRFRYSGERGTIAGGVSADSNFTWTAPSALAVAARLDAPSNARATLITDSRARIEWQDNSTNETGFELRRASTGVVLTLATTGVNATSLNDDDLAPGTEYCYDVRAVRRVGQSSHYSTYSNTDCVRTPTPPPPPPAPPAPTALTTTVVRPVGVSIEIGWNSENTGATTARVERSPDGATGWSPIAVLLYFDNGLAYDTNTVPETAYCYRVVGINDGGEGPASNIMCSAVPNSTLVTSSLVDSTTLRLTWPDNSNVEDGYEVWLYWYGPNGGGCTSGDAGVSEGEYVVAHLPANTTSWQGPRVTQPCDPPTFRYFLYVVATRDDGMSVPSNYVDATGTAVGDAGLRVSGSIPPRVKSSSHRGIRSPGAAEGPRSTLPVGPRTAIGEISFKVPVQRLHASRRR